MPSNARVQSVIDQLHISFARGHAEQGLLDAFVRALAEVSGAPYVGASFEARFEKQDLQLSSAVLHERLQPGATDPPLRFVTAPDQWERLIRFKKEQRLSDVIADRFREILPVGCDSYRISPVRGRDNFSGVVIQCFAADTDSSNAIFSETDLESLTIEFALLLERTRFSQWSKSRGHEARMIGLSSGIRAVESLARRFGTTTCPVLITGATGTGKELVARLVHFHSPRRDKPFIAINCGAFTAEHLLASELFGHAKGAFTGADVHRKGKFEAARGGTLFLDEVSTMSKAMQIALLRTLRYGEIQRVGDDSEILRADVRIVAACNEDLRELVSSGRFREDVYSRLRVGSIQLPPLQERTSDIPLLIRYFIQNLARSTSLAEKRITETALAALCKRHYPDNIAGLENSLFHAFIVSDDVITTEHLPESLSCSFTPSPYLLSKTERIRPLKESVAYFESQYIHMVLEQTLGNVSEAARHLGITRQGLQKKLRESSLTRQTHYRLDHFDSSLKDGALKPM